MRRWSHAVRTHPVAAEMKTPTEASSVTISVEEYTFATRGYVAYATSTNATVLLLRSGVHVEAAADDVGGGICHGTGPELLPGLVAVRRIRIGAVRIHIRERG